MTAKSHAPVNYLAPARMGSRVTANRNRGLALALATAVALAVVLGAAVGAGVSRWAGLAAGVGATVTVVAVAWWASAPLVLAVSGARAASPLDQPRAHNLLDAICAGAGVVKPGLAVVDHPSIDLMAVGRSPARATVVATSGLLAQLTLVEMEAVLAHQVVRIKANQICPATVAVVGLGSLAVLVPRAGGLAAWATGHGSESSADVAAVALTRYPPAMVSALEKVLEGPGPAVPNPTTARAIDHLWTPRRGLEDRIRVLREL